MSDHNQVSQAASVLISKCWRCVNRVYLLQVCTVSFRYTGIIEHRASVQCLLRERLQCRWDFVESEKSTTEHINSARAGAFCEVRGNATGAGNVQKSEENKLIREEGRARMKFAPVLLRVRMDGVQQAHLAWSTVGVVCDSPWATAITSTYYTSKSVLISQGRMNSYHCPGRAGRAGLAVPVGWHYLFENVSLDRPYQGNRVLTASASVGIVAVAYLRVSDNYSLD